MSGPTWVPPCKPPRRSRLTLRSLRFPHFAPG